MSLITGEYCGCDPEFESCYLCELEPDSVIREFIVVGPNDSAVVLTWEVDGNGFTRFWGTKGHDADSVQIGWHAPSS